MKRLVLYLSIFGAFTTAGVFPTALSADTQNLRYRVEVLVFRHQDAEPSPATVDEFRAFTSSYELPVAEELSGPDPFLGAPVPLSIRSNMLNNVWSRLSRLAAYEPLVWQSWEQSQSDYHPPVRIHSEESLGEVYRFTGGLGVLDLAAEDPLAPYRVSLYRLDGSVQLRRSRFLHLDIDLEYRLDDLARLDARPLPKGPPDRMQAMEVISTDQSPGPEEPINAASRPVAPANAPAGQPTYNTDGQLARPEPETAMQPPLLRLHRLQESRQIKTDQIHYFDGPYLGVLARVTSIADQADEP